MDYSLYQHFYPYDPGFPNHHTPDPYLYDVRTFPGPGGQPGFPPGGFPGGGQPPGFPGGGFPGGGQPPGFPGGGFPGGGQQFGGAPTSPPPSYVPQQGISLQAVDPGAIRGCLYRYTYVWLNNGRSFWLYPTFVGRTSISGYRWQGNRWVYYGTDLRRIRSFQCY